MDPSRVFVLAGLAHPGPPKVPEEETAAKLIRLLPAQYRQLMITVLQALASELAPEQPPEIMLPIPDDPLLQELVSHYEDASEQERPGLVAMARLWRTRSGEERHEEERQPDTEGA